MGQRGPDRQVPAPRAVGVDLASDVYLRAGEFSIEQMIAFLAVTLAPSTDEEFPPLRAAGEMSGCCMSPGANELFVYESAVNQILAEPRPRSSACTTCAVRGGHARRRTEDPLQGAA